MAQAQGTQLLREPTISDKYIVFVHANDLWRVDINGGNAIRLSSNIGQESFPHFSPDGKTIAFTGQYDGNSDVYIVSVDGGEPSRLTWHPGADMVTGWTPDGKSVLFRSGRTGYPTGTNQIWKINTSGGMPDVLPIPRAAEGELSSDGKYIAYNPITFWDAEWRNYRGGQAQPIWIVDMKTFDLKQTPRTDNERHVDPVWYKGKVFFLSERDFANNIWSFDPKTDELKQWTFHSDFDVKSIDAGPDMIVYEQGGYLHHLNPTNGNIKQLAITVKGDMSWGRERWEDVSARALSNAQLSPTGKRALFEYRGDIFTVPKEEGSWRNLTNTSSAADRYPIWSPDGSKIAWFSDESGEYKLVISDQYGMDEKKSINLPNPTFYFQPAWSPDGNHIAYTDTDYNLWNVNLESGKSTKIDTDGYAHPNRTLNPVWSPDSKWIAYVKLQKSQFKVVMAHNIDSGKTLQLTDGMSDSITPVWDESGKYLYFLSSTNYGLGSGWLDMSSYNSPSTHALYMIILSKDEPSPFLPVSDDEVAETESEEKEKSDEISVTIDMENIANRIISIDIPERNYTGLISGPKGHVFYTEAVPNEGVKLNRYSIKDQKAITFLSSVNSATVSMDRKNLLYNSGSSWGIVSSTGGEIKPGGGSLALGGLKVKVDPKAEAHQIFKEGWRFMRDFLYVDNIHGAPWDDVYEWYSPWIDHVKHRSDLNYVVDIMSGEVAVGHSYVSGGDYPNLESVPAGLLGVDISVNNGAYRIDKIYTGESWNPNVQGPLAIPGIDVNEGDYILEVNGEELKSDVNFFSYFEGTVGRQVTLLINDKPNKSGAHQITTVPISNEGALRSWDWVEGNRRKVDEMSDGKLAYVWVPNTGDGGYTYFNRYYFAQQDKKGAIIDERNNGGGSAADYIVDVLNREVQGFFNSKAGDRYPFTSPGAGLWGPKVMIINERAGSGGDLLPFLFRQMEIGPLVGTKTWGGLVGTWDTPRFIDGGRMVAPRGGFYNLDGEWDVEGIGISPDIEVMQTPKDVINGRDPQLERAVKEALELMKGYDYPVIQTPKDPVRWKRPQNKQN
jgi:tricorn protease